MARRLVWMPVFPRVTVSEALNFRGRGGRVRALWAKLEEGNQAAPAAHAARCRNSRRFMGTSGNAESQVTPNLGREKGPFGLHRWKEMAKDPLPVIKTSVPPFAKALPVIFSPLSEVQNERETSHRHKIHYKTIYFLQPTRVLGAKRWRGDGLLDRASLRVRRAGLRAAKR